MPADPLRFIDAITREVLPRERNSQPTRALIIRARFDTSAADLWEALTSPTRLAPWFLPVSGDLRVGGHYQIEGNANGQITSCSPPHDFNLTWDWEAQRSWLAISLSPASPGTWLRLEHVEPVPVGAPDEYGPGAGGVGWTRPFWPWTSIWLAHPSTVPMGQAGWRRRKATDSSGPRATHGVPRRLRRVQTRRSPVGQRLARRPPTRVLRSSHRSKASTAPAACHGIREREVWSRHGSALRPSP